MTRRAGRRFERLLGYGLLGLGLVVLVALLAQDAVRADIGRVGQALRSATRDAMPGDRTYDVASLDGMHAGLALYRMDAQGDARPVGHVVATIAGTPPRIVLRPAPGESLAGLTHVQVYAPSRKLSAALELAMGDAEARAFAKTIAARLEQLWKAEIYPDVQRRLPAFLARVDPTKDTEARRLFQGLSKSLVEKLQPVLDELLRHVMAAVKEKLGVLDRLGLLWDMIRGDEKGIRDALLPAAKGAATQWWTKNQARVLKELGDGVADRWPEIRAWLTGEFLDASMDELVRPIFQANRVALEREGERIMRDAVRRFVEAPSGGFRVRFASLLRHNLLNKDTALLLWLPEDAPRDR